MSNKVLVYEIYPIAWEKPAKEAGKTPLQLIAEHVYRLKALGVTHIWVAPLYPSPRADHGYDITDYYAIDSRFGTMDDFCAFVDVAHWMGIKVLMDLVLNHTSIYHPWFRQHPEYYCWSGYVHVGWHNLFDNGHAWTWDIERSQFYLHLFHEQQADLNWFNGDEVNQELVGEFQRIIGHWLKAYGVDGFRLDIPQALNKDFDDPDLGLEDLLYGDKAERVLNALFGENAYWRTESDEKPFLMMECFDPSHRDLIEYYAEFTPVQYVLDVTLKDEADRGLPKVLSSWMRSASMDRPGFMLDLESHDSPRMPSRLQHYGCTPQNILRRMFNCGADAICLYQGQELGLHNPTRRELPDYEMVQLDAQLAMNLRLNLNGAPLTDEERAHSRANARAPFPLDEYKRQEDDPDSVLNFAKHQIRVWQKL